MNLYNLCVTSNDSSIRRVLVVGMLDSVHMYRWLSQFTDSDVIFKLLPSKKFKRIHPGIIELVKSDSHKFQIATYGFTRAMLGYQDYFLNFSIQWLVKFNFRKRLLEKSIHSWRPHIVHGIEIQGAGYLIDSIISEKYLNEEKSIKFIITNFGSDIYYFQHKSDHREIISRLLSKIDYYSAECERDYSLAKDLGFKGKFLDCMPNAGGFDNVGRETQIGFQDRNLILFKCYGGEFGLGKLAVKIARKVLDTNSQISIFLYSVTQDLVQLVINLEKEFPNRLKYSTTKNPLTHRQMLDKFKLAKIYVGLSRSDGIGTSFLESLVYGAYPIQTDTSCISEWIKKGVIASQVSQDEDNILNEINRILYSRNFKEEHFQDSNLLIARKELDSKVLKLKAVNYYKI